MVKEKNAQQATSRWARLTTDAMSASALSSSSRRWGETRSSVGHDLSEHVPPLVQLRRGIARSEGAGEGNLHETAVYARPSCSTPSGYRRRAGGLGYDLAIEALQGVDVTGE